MYKIELALVPLDPDSVTSLSKIYDTSKVIRWLWVNNDNLEESRTVFCGHCFVAVGESRLKWPTIFPPLVENKSMLMNGGKKVHVEILAVRTRALSFSRQDIRAPPKPARHRDHNKIYRRSMKEVTIKN